MLEKTFSDILKTPQIITPIATFQKCRKRICPLVFLVTFLKCLYRIDYLQHFKGVANKDFLLLFSDVFKTSQKPTHFLFYVLY